jgi:glycosyltransferase involved in cell wall biosynthesis
MLEAQGLSGGAWTALRTTHSVDSRHRSARSLFSLVERIIAPSRWVAAVLRSNGVPDAKIVLCPQGVTKRDGGGEAVARGEDRRPALRAAFAGRLDPAKGAHVVVEAMGLLRGEDIALDLFAVVPGSDDPYYGKLRAACAKDARIRLMPAIPNREMIGVLGGYDVVVVPSQGFETGPLVVLEAFAAGVPVLGSDIGGIAERVRHGVDGLLIPRADPAAWAGALAKLASDAGALARLRSGIRPSRSMADVCVEMKAVYAALVPPAAHAVTRTR